MSLARRMELIRSVAPFALFDTAALRAVAEIADAATLPAGTRLFRTGEPAGGALLVESGEVRLAGPGLGPAPVIAGPGTLIGIRALVIPVPAAFDADAITAVRLLALPRVAFLEVLAAHPSAARPVRRHFALALRHMTDALDDLRQDMTRPGPQPRRGPG